MDGLSVSRGVTAKEPKSSVWKRCPSPGSLPVTQKSTLNLDEPENIGVTASTGGLLPWKKEDPGQG
ncbi:hypothetical protein DPPLL_22440 [Desulfofustis limnaeus]|uniref:Uncharacterized protein n=1 Tax=Desulfofustis limnaeus TaxID=2740163 RepID=A0ABM7WA59_9BACT|nr:hypothetical protein DPPLL_22440 [Desulfofustis limnaeus]